MHVVLLNIQTEIKKVIEQRCELYLKTMNTRLEVIEKNLDAMEKK